MPDLRERTGLFWDAMNRPAPLPPAAATLGMELVDADPDEGTLELAFAATEAFTNPFGNVLGAFLAAMLYDTVGPTLLSTLGPDEFQSTMEMDVRFLRPVRPGRVTCTGRIVHRDGDLAFVDTRLFDANGELAATATAIARVIPLGVEAA